MTKLTKAHSLDMIVGWGASAVLSAALGWSAWIVTHSATLAALAVLAGAVAAGLALRLAGDERPAEVGFVPVSFDDGAEDEGELLLDDPLAEAADDSRVVQLFARAEPTPGELVDRIADFLGEDRRTLQAEAQEQPAMEASAALHAALANIRASLR